jgi:multicomponent Na+:H+ antiporter subunit F
VSTLLHGVALFLLLNVAAGMVRIARGPTAADRMLAAQLFGTTGVAILLLFSAAAESGALRDAALVFALLAAVVAVTFVKRGWIPAPERDGRTADGAGETAGSS